MSKIFVNENPQPRAPLRHQPPPGLAPPDSWSPPAAKPSREGLDHPAVFVAGLVMLAVPVVALVMWAKQIAMIAAVFVLFGLFARSPLLAVGGALTLLLLAR